MIEVADTGRGMSPEVLKCIFDPFYTTKPVGKGTGLGLAIVDAIAKRHGGSFSLAPRVEGGLQARLELPAAA